MGKVRAGGSDGSGQSWAIAIVLLLGTTTTLPADGQATPSALQSVVESEKSFARAALDRGVRSAFLQYFADDSIVFVPAPANGRAFYTKFVEKDRRLIWQPIFATISSAGDLGLTTGPWKMQKSAGDETSLGFGEFVSLWKKQSDDSWKVILDFGISHPQPEGNPVEIRLSPPMKDPGNKVDLSSALRKSEKEFNDGLRTDAGRTLLERANEDIRVLREDAFPAVGKEAAKEILAFSGKQIARSESSGGLSSSCDLAYRYGSYSAQDGDQAENGYYLTIWQVDPDRNWKIILDLQRKVPASEGKQD